MTNPDNVGGLPTADHLYDIAADAWDQHQTNCRVTTTAGSLRKAVEAIYGELCRAAPAGGDVERFSPDCEPCSDFESWVGCMRPDPNGQWVRYAPAGSGEVDGWLLDGCLIYRLSDGRNQTNTHEINVTMWDGSRELAVRDKAAAALLRKLKQGADYVMVPREALRVEAHRLRYRATETCGLSPQTTDAGAQMVHTAEALEQLASQGQEGGK